MRVLSMMGRGGVATRLTTSDTATALSAALLTVEGKKMSACTIQCDKLGTNSARIAWGGTTPTLGASAVGYYLEAGKDIRIVGEHNCASLMYLSAITVTPAVLQIIPEY